MQNTPTYEELLALYQSEKSKNEILNKVLQEKDDELSKLRKEMRIANLLLFEFLKKIEDKDIKLKKQLEERFGIKSDKAETVYTNEVEIFSSKKIGEKKKPGRKAGTKNAAKFDLSKIEQKEEIIDLKDKVCDVCGADLVYSKDLISYKVDIIPAKIVLTKYIVKQYKCTNCTESNIHEEINTFSNESSVSVNSPIFK